MSVRKETIFVGLSGGVDSSVAALRLINEGHTVVGVFVKVWQPDFLECNWERERLDAMRVAAHLDIPFLTFEAEAVYKKEVVDYMIAEYRIGRTPNPDVMCNKHVKFGAFLSFAREQGATKVATGHYARIEQLTDRAILSRGTDSTKDQSYFLWMLTQEQLKHIRFPLGDARKSEVRKEAEKAGIPTFNKDESQGICFLGHVDIKEFLSHYIDTTEGNVLDVSGTRIGKHHGAIFYTIGQRHGFTTRIQGDENVPHYVVAKDIATNTITVETQAPQMPDAQITLTHTNHLSTNWKGTLSAQFRYRQEPVAVTVEEGPGECAMLTALENIESPSSGQSCVLYRNDECLGGGIIA